MKRRGISIMFCLFLLIFIGCKKDNIPEYPKPVIQLFRILPDSVIVNSSAVITWKFLGKYGELNGLLLVKNSDSIETAILTKDRTYTLVVFNEAGETVSETKTVMVFTPPHIADRTDIFSNRDWNYTKEIVWVNEWQKWAETTLSESQKTRKITFDNEGNVKINGQYSGPWSWINEKDSVNITGDRCKYSDLTDTTFTTYSRNGNIVGFYTRK